jgi:hypothetical protein
VIGKSHQQLSDADRVNLENLMQGPTAAIKGAEPATGAFPLVINHPGLGRAVEDNVVLNEWLASHGYVLATSAFQSENAVYVNIEAHVQLKCSDIISAHIRRTITRLICHHFSKPDLSPLPSPKSCRKFNQKGGSEIQEPARICVQSDTES